VEQIGGIEAQGRELRAAGARKVFAERVSSVAKREQLEAALDYCREGDVLVVTKLDRLAGAWPISSPSPRTLLV
jgi:DNA invertase Pin-like site-specific DNA recombinase